MKGESLTFNNMFQGILLFTLVICVVKCTSFEEGRPKYFHLTKAVSLKLLDLEAILGRFVISICIGALFMQQTFSITVVIFIRNFFKIGFHINTDGSSLKYRYTV